MGLELLQNPAVIWHGTAVRSLWKENNVEIYSTWVLLRNLRAVEDDDLNMAVVAVVVSE